MKYGRGLERKVTSILLFFVVVISVTIGGIGYKTYMDSTFTRYRNAATSVLRLAQGVVDADDMRICLESGTRSEIYTRTQASLDRMKDSLGVAYIYLFDITDDGLILYYVNAFSERERESIAAGGKINSLGDGERFPDDVTLQLLDIDNLETPLAEIVNKTRHGYMLSVYSPVRDSKGESIGLLGVDIDMDEINADLLAYISTVAAGATATGLLFTALLISFIRRNVTGPIKIIAKKAGEFAAANHDKGELSVIKLDINKQDEIGVMAGAFEKMTEDLVRYVSELTAAVMTKERMQSELDVARNIQASILPSAFPKDAGFDLYASMTPAKEIGGDFYDFFMTDDSHIVVVIADVSGKGIPAALFMMVARALIKKEAGLGGEPNVVLESVNKALCEGNSTYMFVTVFIGVYDIMTGVLQYANAGHNPPLLLKRDGEVRLVRSPSSIILAVDEQASYSLGEITIEPGDCLLLYTDGVTEAGNDREELFSEARLVDVLGVPTPDRVSARGVIGQVSDELEKFVGSAEQSDDITMLALARRGPV